MNQFPMVHPEALFEVLMFSDGLGTGSCAFLWVAEHTIPSHRSGYFGANLCLRISGTMDFCMWKYQVGYFEKLSVSVCSSLGGVS